MTLPRVLMAHNFYQQAGGEDAVFAAECELLRQHGHDVVVYTDSNKRLNQTSKFAAAKNVIWSSESRKKISIVIKEFKPDIAHFHNTYGVMSPSVYYACREANVPIIQTLHNYRLLCSNAFLYRDGKVCEECLGKKIPLAGIKNRCYRESRIHTAAVSSMTTTHRLLGTWDKVIDRYIALTEFSKQKFVEGGLPENKISVKGNFLLNDPGGRSQEDIQDYVLFVGRLSEEKGILDVIDAWEKLDLSIPLKIAGDGPMYQIVEQQIFERDLGKEIELLGWQNRESVQQLMIRCRFLLYVSKLYENYPMIVVESRALGVPVIASELGVAKSFVRNYFDGLYVIPTDSKDLAKKVQWAWFNPDKMWDMGVAARKNFEAENLALENYRNLMSIYKSTIDEMNTKI